MSKTSIIRADGVRDSTEQRVTENYAAAFAKNLFDAEAAARATADSVLQSNIDAEAAARATADRVLQSNIDAEAAARATADSGLQSNIDAEAAARMQADSGLQGNINKETTKRIQADSNLQKNINAVAEAVPKFAASWEIREEWNKPSPKLPTITLDADYLEDNFIMHVTQSGIEKLQEIDIESEFILIMNVKVEGATTDQFGYISIDPVETPAECYAIGNGLASFHNGLNTYRFQMISHHDQFLPGKIYLISY